MCLPQQVAFTAPSAILSVALFFAVCTLLFVGGIPSTIATALRLFLFAGIFGAGISFVGMEYFLFRFDDSHPDATDCLVLGNAIPFTWGRSLLLHRVFAFKRT